jgi:hypothetical protein
VGVLLVESGWVGASNDAPPEAEGDPVKVPNPLTPDGASNPFITIEMLKRIEKKLQAVTKRLQQIEERLDVLEASEHARVGNEIAEPQCGPQKPSYVSTMTTKTPAARRQANR